MIQSNSEGFKFMDGLGAGTIVVESGRLKEYVDYIKVNNVEKMYVCDLYFNSVDLDFLKELTSIKEININSRYITNANGMYALKDLKKLTINDIRREVDILEFPKLTTLYVNLECNIQNISFNNNITSLGVRLYKSKSKTFEEYQKLNNLAELRLTQTNLKDLSGIKNLTKLKYIELNYNRSLLDISELAECKNLEEIQMSNCKKIHNLTQTLENIPTLKKIILSDCGEIQNLEFVKKLPNLKFISFVGTKVISGDLNPIVGLEYAGFDNKKHYNYRNEQINPEFAKRAKESLKNAWKNANK